MGKVALQLYTVRELANENLLGLLERIAELGYQGVQFAGFHDHSAETVHKQLQALGLTPAGAHVPIELLQSQLDEVLRFHTKLDNSLLICPFLPESMRKSKDDYLRTADQFNEIGEKLTREGFAFGYHNHAFEFERFDETSGFELLFEHTDSSNVKMELDCYWAAYAGSDPDRLIQKYQDRCISLHVKDGKQEEGEMISTEIGNGTLDIPKLITSGKEHDVNWFIVEQEHFTGDPLISAKENVSALKQLI
ncbi:sugar phosphate isomerase/epimerase family protein [Virgibacillus salexigens]|uniref:Hydroxypyruvate isomerase n=1 Tax=Virgibacillus massiliensis TaxID=1462526 RepID=A0A024Q7M4_9BACI|nr:MULTISPECIES: sugar phosphate isomerase/epimerase [Virgibacillus]MYL40748.1 TIM barrel protein [Virgibacillus massiliensis]CDQ38459.1 Hydroxypyruvate isomerase [Virgibacillus massiliensis]